MSIRKGFRALVARRQAFPVPDAAPAALLDILRTRRPAYSIADSQFVRGLQKKFSAHNCRMDSAGNLFVRVGNSGRSLFIAHTDTAHESAGAQAICATSGGLLASDADCLGADDGAGLYVLIRMIEAGVPGTYMFARGEERGGLGSAYAANAHDWGGYARCVSFDRRGQHDVITHQLNGRCASGAFALALSAALNARGLDYRPCDGGLFTDSAMFTGVIGECTNLSVGYEHEHSASETLDYKFLERLVAASIAIYWDSLPSVRKAGQARHDGFDKGAFLSYEPYGNDKYGGEHEYK
jgi:hypothetical protein